MKNIRGINRLKVLVVAVFGRFWCCHFCDNSGLWLSVYNRALSNICVIM